MSDRELTMCLLFGRWKWYRKYRGGHWSKVVGFPYYWINRKPFDFERLAGHVLAEEVYEGVSK